WSVNKSNVQYQDHDPAAKKDIPAEVIRPEFQRYSSGLSIECKNRIMQCKRGEEAAPRISQALFLLFCKGYFTPDHVVNQFRRSFLGGKHLRFKVFGGKGIKYHDRFTVSNKRPLNFGVKFWRYFGQMLIKGIRFVISQNRHNNPSTITQSAGKEKAPVANLTSLPGPASML
ncbi:MAG: hypothetical protein LBP93_05400, partial [Treponema sp.]|nr:hypothetical protein [Treponema sp.]